MGIRIIQATHPDALVRSLAASIATNPSSMPDVFDKIEVGVPDVGVSRWVSRHLAMAHSICGNVEFPFASSLIFNAMAVPGDDKTIDAWHRDALCWTILSVLPELLDEDAPSLDPLKQYLSVVLAIPDTDLAEHLRERSIDTIIWAFAREIAELFDDYITYRPLWAQAWNQGQVHRQRTRWSPDVSKLLERNLAWQRPLWLACHKRVQTSLKLAAIDSVNVGPSHTPLRLFMPTELSPLMVAGLRIIGQCRPIEIYVLSHGQSVWNRVREHHGLGIRMGAITREILDNDAHLNLHPFRASCGRVELDIALLSESFATELEWLEEKANKTDSTILGRIQSLISGEAKSTDLCRLPLDDDSVQFHSCHGARRQVEVLRDTLLHLFDRHVGCEDTHPLQPRHVLVLVSDLEKYAPLIEAIFGRESRFKSGSKRARPEATPKIEVSMVGRSFRHVNSVADALLRLLAMGGLGERMVASDVVELLSLEPVLHRFDMTGEDLAYVQTWIKQTQIRWGMDGEHRGEVEDLGAFGTPGEEGKVTFPQLDLNSWVHGLERLLLGVALADDAAMIFDDSERVGLIPVDDMEGHPRSLIGRFVDAVNTIMDALVSLRIPREIHEWVQLIVGDPTSEEVKSQPGILAALTSTSGSKNWLTRHVIDVLNHVSESASRGLNGESGPKINVRGLHAILADAFEVSSGFDSTPVSSVTFASLNTHSRVPHPVVALLGFDDDAFPRTPNRRQFDGVALTRQVGDIDPADTDRARFLDALMLAERHLVILYSGRHLRTNAERAPSVVVGELMDAIDDAFEIESGAQNGSISPSEMLTIEHPLQAFSPKNFQTEGHGVPCLVGARTPSVPRRPWGYDPRMLMEAQAVAHGAQDGPWTFVGDDGEFLDLTERLRPKTDNEREVVQLDDLVRFFREPASLFLRRQLGIFTYSQVDEIRDREGIRINPLEAYSFKSTLTNLRWHVGDKPWDIVRDHQTIRRILADGGLPWGPASERALASQWGHVSDLFGHGLEKFTSQGCIDGCMEFHDGHVELELPGNSERPYTSKISLTGRIGPVLGDHLIKIYPAKNKRKRNIESWLHSLFWAAITPSSTASVWSVFTHSKSPFDGEAFVLDDNGIEDFDTPEGLTQSSTKAAWARGQLADLVDLYLIGRQRPIPLFLEASWAACWYLRAFNLSYDDWSLGELSPKEEKAYDSALRNVRDCFFGSDFSLDYDLARPATQLLYSDYLPIIDGRRRQVFEPRFYEYALRLWRGAYGPMKTSARRTKDKYKPIWAPDRGDCSHG